MSKRLFQILDEMNVNDGENKTRTVAISNTLVSVKKVKAGGLVEMGVDAQSANELMDASFGSGKYIAILCVVDFDEYKIISDKH